ncbi:MAG TPA: hypothetical protein V6C65_38875 [Allocoleopsis sp.]
MANLKIENLEKVSSLQQQYSKADFFKISRLGNNFSLNAFQFDYLKQVKIIEDSAKSGKNSTSDVSIDASEAGIVSVAKLVLDPDGLMNLRNEIDIILKESAKAGYVLSNTKL